jgi:hypothetical protein
MRSSPVPSRSRRRSASRSGRERGPGRARLRADLHSGEWERRWGRLLTLDELDRGYRVLAVWP